MSRSGALTLLAAACLTGEPRIPIIKQSSMRRCSKLVIIQYQVTVITTFIKTF